MKANRQTLEKLKKETEAAQKTLEDTIVELRKIMTDLRSDDFERSVALKIGTRREADARKEWERAIRAYTSYLIDCVRQESGNKK